MVKYRYMKLNQPKIIVKTKSCVFGSRPTSGGTRHLPSVVVVMLLTLFGGVLVAHSYIPLVSLPGVTDASSTTGVDLSSYLSGMIKLVIALAGALSILMLVIAGTQYVAASINPNAKKDALEKIQNSLIGIALVLSSWLLLNTINPDLVNFSLVLPPISGSTVAPGVTVTTPPAAGACPDCVDVTSTMFPSKPPGAGCAGSGPCKVSQGISIKLMAFWRDARMEGFQWRVTEMWPPTRSHAMPCHGIGTCVDASFNNQNQKTARHINHFIDIANLNGLRAQYEVPTLERLNELRSATHNGTVLPLIQTNAGLKHVPGITGEHFSIYN